MEQDEMLPSWFVRTRNISAELALGFGVALLVLQFWLKALMRIDHYEIALTIIIPLFLITLVLSCSKAIDVLKNLKQNNGN